jgi:hypothetical protein
MVSTIRSTWGWSSTIKINAAFISPLYAYRDRSGPCGRSIHPPISVASPVPHQFTFASGALERDTSLQLDAARPVGNLPLRQRLKIVIFAFCVRESFAAVPHAERAITALRS